MDYNFNGRILQNGQPIGGGEESQDISSSISTSFFEKNRNIYSALQFSGDTLKFVLSGTFGVNSSKTSGTYGLTNNIDLTLSDDILSHIYRADGTNLTQDVSSESLENKQVICAFPCLVKVASNEFQQTSIAYFESTQARKIIVKIALKDAIGSFGNGIFIDCRTFLTI